MPRNKAMITPSIQFHRELWKQVRIEAIKQGIPAAELVRRATRAALPKEETAA